MITAVALFVLGLIFGSFVTALVWRLHEHKDWVTGRSQCTNCGHQLNSADLVPVFSWLYLRGKCRYCKAPISSGYPLTELMLGSSFVISYLLWPVNLAGAQWILFVSWLAVSICLTALFIYDLRWMLLPSRLIYSALLVAAASNLAYLTTQDDKTKFMLNWVLSVAVASGIFFILHIVSQGKWIGFGDVRLGLVTGTVLHKPALSFLMIFIASLLGTAFVLPSLITRQMKVSMRLPYGPFLILSTVICLLVGQSILDWYVNLVSF